MLGSSIASMMIVVLTTNEPANEHNLKVELGDNVPNISSLNKLIPKENIYCVSLKDLREKKNPPLTKSSKTLDAIADNCQ